MVSDRVFGVFDVAGTQHSNVFGVVCALLLL